MSNLEEILKYSNEPKSVAKYYSMIASYLEKDEHVEKIEIEVNLTPKALIYTNNRIIECKSKSFGTELEFKFWVNWESLSGIQIKKGILTDDIIYTIGRSNVTFMCEGYASSRMLDLEKYTNEKIESFKPKTAEVHIESKAPEDEIYIKLEKLKNLFDKGLISDAEFSAKKSQLLDSI